MNQLLQYYHDELFILQPYSTKTHKSVVITLLSLLLIDKNTLSNIKWSVTEEQPEINNTYHLYSSSPLVGKEAAKNK